MLPAILTALAMQPDPAVLRRIFEDALARREQQYAVAVRLNALAPVVEVRTGSQRTTNSCGTIASSVASEMGPVEWHEKQRIMPAAGSKRQ